MGDLQPTSQLITVGASAGGVESLATLVSTLPTPFPAPIVIAQHLDPTRPSQLQEILARRTNLPVHSVVGHEPLEAGVIYVVPSNRHVTITDHHVGIDPEGTGRPKPSIDLLFETAAAVFGEGLIAVVLSGLGSDGAAGARRVKEAGGTVVIQNPRTAPYPSMPQALAPTTVDVIADVDAMGPLLDDLLTGAYTPAGPRDDRQVRTFLEELRDRTGIDFSRYKMPTIQRRLQRRLVATGAHSLAEYRRCLQAHPEEYDRLINAFLIKVTEFFRDRELFVYLREHVLPELIERGRAHGNELRFWSAGCATGEEAYSLALLVADALGTELEAWTVRIFATDLDGEAVDFARRGRFPATAISEVPAGLKARYFTEEQGAFSVAKSVRGLLVFGEHDLGQRPLFPRIDLCLCRNVLIYFTPELQRRALETFAFALREGGVLVLGSAETTSPLPSSFTPLNTGLRVYRRHGDRPSLISPIKTTKRPRLGHTPSLPGAGEELARVRREVREGQVDQIRTEELLLRLPVGLVVVDRNYDIQHLNGEARRLLGIHTEAVGEDFVHLAERVPAPALRTAIDAALGGEERSVEAIPTDALIPGETRYLRISCRPYRAGANAAEAAVLIVADVTEVERTRAEVAHLRAALEQAGAANRFLLDANQELTTLTALLRRSTEDFLLNNEEIQAATEEVETLNEEQQATNEELETLNEEQQATVEELETTNEELRTRNRELRDLAATVETERGRLAAILASMGDAVVVLDAQGQVVFTSALFDEMFGATGGAFAAEDAEGHPLPTDATPQERLRRGEAFQMQFTIEGADKKRRWYEATGRPVNNLPRYGAAPDQHGAPPPHDAVLVIRDITDRTLRNLQDQFLALAAHELRTPLTAIIGLLQLLLRGIETTPATSAEHARLALGEARRLARLVNDLQEVSRFQHERLTVVRRPVNISMVVEQAVELARVLDGNRLIRLEGSAAPLRVDGDAERLQQVVLNLVTNALVHAAPSPVDLRLQPREGAIELEVRDYGPGIEPDELAQLFTRFYQGGAAHAHQGAGMGLGLYIAREIVEAHQGTITATSTIGEGTVFTVRLPEIAD